MGHLILQGDNSVLPGFSLLGKTTLGITIDNPGPDFHARFSGLERDDIREHRQYGVPEALMASFSWRRTIMF